MRSDKFFSAMEDIDSKFIDKILDYAVNDKTEKPKRIVLFFSHLKRAIPTAIPLTIVISIFSICLTLIPKANERFYPSSLQQNSTTQTPTSNIDYSSYSSIRGLPVENFILSEAQNGDIIMDRMTFGDFGSLSQWGVDYFAFVKVENTRAENADNNSHFDRQNKKQRHNKGYSGQ